MDVGSVLEFVKEKIVEPYSKLFIDERSVSAVDDSVENGVGVVDGYYVFLLLDFRECAPEAVCNAKGIDLFAYGYGREVFTVFYAEQACKCLEGFSKGRFDSVKKVSVGLGKPF